MTTEQEENHDEVLGKMVQELSITFDEMCQRRHEAGQEEYGQFTFLENDVIRMMVEEIVDTANYCRMQFIKLMLLQYQLEAEIANHGLHDQEGNITIGVKSFRGTGDGWKDKE